MGRNLIELPSEVVRQNRLPLERRWGPFYDPLKCLALAYQRVIGEFSPEDQLRIACCCEPPVYFLRRGCLIAHPYGITISADEIGADCSIGQNVTIGTSGRTMSPGEHTKDKPRLGHLVRCYAGAVISGNVSIGNRVVIAANAFVDKDVPDDSIVYGCNVVKPLKEHHRNYLKMQLWHCINIYKLVPGLVYASGRLWIDGEWARKRAAMIDEM